MILITNPVVQGALWPVVKVVAYLLATVAAGLIVRYVGRRLHSFGPGSCVSCRAVTMLAAGQPLGTGERDVVSAIRRTVELMESDQVIKCPKCGEVQDDEGGAHASYAGGVSAAACEDCGHRFVVIETVKRTYETRSANG